jgi:hypothetical protein
LVEDGPADLLGGRLDASQVDFAEFLLHTTPFQPSPAGLGRYEEIVR